MRAFSTNKRLRHYTPFIAMFILFSVTYTIVDIYVLDIDIFMSGLIIYIASALVILNGENAYHAGSEKIVKNGTFARRLMLILISFSTTLIILIITFR